MAADALRSVPTAMLDEASPPLPDALREIGSLPQWALANAGKVSVKWDRHSAAKYQSDPIMEACRAGGAPNPAVLGTHDEARAWLVRLRGQPSRVRNRDTGKEEDGPPIDALSLRFLPFPGRRLVGLDFDGVIDCEGRFHPHPIGDGGPDFAPWDGKPPSVHVYCGRAWKHFRWTGVGFAYWYRAPIAERSQLICEYLRDIARDTAARKAMEDAKWPASSPSRGFRLPRVSGGTRVSWARRLSAAEVARILGGSMSRGRLEAHCPRCAETGRVSSSGRPSLVLSDGPDGVRVTCWYCREHGDHRDVWAAVGEAVARYLGVAS
ncbi:MAG: hypothetical protein EBT00_16310 [Proteobacteria bacterium]|nr:hypothetical protein [Pseudomonadota bacterium]